MRWLLGGNIKVVLGLGLILIKERRRFGCISEFRKCAHVANTFRIIQYNS